MRSQLYFHTTGNARVPKRARSILRSVVDWLRAGYPSEAPSAGYSPLIALNGPLALTENQAEAIAAELRANPCDTADIDVAITKVTDRLPSAAQARQVMDALAYRTDHEANFINRAS